MSDAEQTWPVLGHEQVIGFLKQSVLRGTVAHAYLFVGPEHIGKETVARFFVGELLFNGSASNEQLTQVTQGSHPDVVWLQREPSQRGTLKNSISIEQIRELTKRLSLNSFLGGYKIAVVPDAQLMTTEAAHALLKTLEEPKGKTVFILLTTSTTALPATVASRCQIITFSPVSSAVICDGLVQRGVSKTNAKTITALAGGRPGAALHYVEQAEALQQYRESVLEFLQLPNQDIASRFMVVKNLVSGFDTQRALEVVSVWQRCWRDVLLAAFGLLDNLSHPFAAAQISQLASHYSVTDLLRAYQQLRTAKIHLQANVNPKLVLENICLTL